MNKEDLLTKKLQSRYESLYKNLNVIAKINDNLNNDYLSLFYREIKVKFGEDFYFYTGTGRVRISSENLKSWTDFNILQYLEDFKQYDKINAFYIKAHYIERSGKKSKQMVSIRIDLEDENWRKRFSKI